MAVQDDIVRFLRSAPSLTRINFEFRSFRVYPTAYQKDVADAIASGAVMVRTKGASSPAAGASYSINYDSLELSPAFHIGSIRDQAFLIHECTHAHLDIQCTGIQSAHENEAVAYLAEAIFLETLKQPPLGTESIRIVSHRLANMVLAGTYTVSRVDTDALVSEVSKHSHYATTVNYISNGFKRGLVQQILRNLP